MAAAKETHAALVLKENEWQQYQDANLAELARQKAAAERRAERANATLLGVYDGARARTVLSNLAWCGPKRTHCVRHSR